MLKFEPCTVELLRSMSPVFRALPTFCAELSAGTIWMWRAEQEPQICVHNGTLVLRQTMNGYPAFTYPVGEDVDGTLDALAEYVRAENIALRFFAMDKRALRRLLHDPRFPDTMWGCDRRWSDYLYPAEPFVTLEGEGMGRFRYEVRHFARLYGEPEIRALLPEHHPQALGMLEDYAREHPDMDKLEKAELRHSRELLSVCRDLQLPAAGLWVGDTLAAFAIGEVVGKTLMVHVLKALQAYSGVYRAMFRGFVSYVRETYDGSLRWINYEDDSGDPGLRASKELYHPICLVHKYQAHVRTPGARAGRPPVLTAGPVLLTPFRETDKEIYLRMNLDAENNRWWGYDYAEDYTVPARPDAESFYDSVQFDMAVGDSINFAVRERTDGPMIGELLLWDFTDRGSAHIGYRLLPEYQGRRLSAPAAAALADYAEKLGLEPWIKCNPDNLPGQHTARAIGFREVRRDGEWVYFNRNGKEIAI